MSSSANPKLPRDVVVEILKRLPVESLLRFRCVSRSWRSTIDDPRFVALHLNHSAHDASKWYLLRLDLWHPVHRLCSLFPNLPLALPSHSQIEIPFVNPLSRYSLVGSCNGFICVKEYPGNGGGRKMYLWNFFTRKHRAVPPPGPGHHFRRTAEALGFGFDARRNDYKILRILYSLDNNNRWFGGTIPQVGIYSLRADSWRSLECEVPAFCGYRRAYRRPVFLNGNLHWFVFKLDDLGAPSGYRSIVLFNVAGEVFDEMAPPEEISHTHDVTSVMSVAVLNDLLAVLVSFKDAVVHPEPHSVCSVWVMREYGVPESWTKLYSFEPWGVVAGFDGFTRNGELLMEIDDGDRVSWNPITGQYADLSLPVECHLVTIMESLDSL